MQKFWDRVTTLLDSPSVVDLAKMLDVKRSTLSSWIHNDRRPPMGVAMKLSSLTGVRMEKLEHGLDWEPPEEDDEVADETSPLLKTVMHMIKNLGPQELELLKDLLPYLKNYSSTEKAKPRFRDFSPKN